MTKVDVFYFHKGERWFGARFKHPTKGWICQAYGSTEKELVERLGEILNHEFGLGGYSINELENDFA